MNGAKPHGKWELRIIHVYPMNERRGMSMTTTSPPPAQPRPPRLGRWWAGGGPVRSEFSQWILVSHSAPDPKQKVMTLYSAVSHTTNCVAENETCFRVFPPMFSCSVSSLSHCTTQSFFKLYLLFKKIPNAATCSCYYLVSSVSRTASLFCPHQTGSSEH